MEEFFLPDLSGRHQLGYGGTEVSQALPDHPYLPGTFADDLGNLTHFLGLVQVRYHLPVLVPPLLFVESGGRHHGM